MKKKAYHLLASKKHGIINKKIKLEKITMDAQSYIVTLYESVGFKQVSDVYDEADIPHIKIKYTGEV